MRNYKILVIILAIIFWGCEDKIINPDASIPTVKIISPTMNSIVSEVCEITIEATDDKKIIRLEIVINSNLYYSTDSSSNLYTFAWHPYGTDGSQQIIEAIVYDSDGNRATSSAVIVKFYNFTPFLNNVSIINDSLFKLEWTDHSQIETGFEIERATGDANFTLIATADSNDTLKYVYDTIDVNQLYRFRMRAVSRDQKSSYSNTRTASLLLTAPTTVNAVLTGDTMVTISWADTNSFKDGYIVSLGNIQKVIWGDTNSVQIAYNIIRGGTYPASVRVMKNNQLSPAKSIIVSFTFDNPSNLRTESAFVDKIILKWNDNTTTEKGFIIFRGAVSGVLSEIARVGANVTDYTDNVLDTNLIYVYKVKAFTNINQSFESNFITVGFASGIIQENSHSFSNFREGVFSENFQYFFKNKNRSAAMYSVPDMNFIRDLETPPDTQYGPYPEIVASYDGSRVSRGFDISYSGSGSGSRTAIWNTTTGALQDYYNTSCIPTPIAFSKDNSKIIVRNCSKIMSYSLPGGTSPITLLTNYVQSMPYMKFDVIAFGIQGSIKVFDLSNGTLMKTISTSLWDKPLGFSPDAKYLISSSSYTIDIYDLDLLTKIFSQPIYNMKRAFMTNDNKILILVGTNDVSLYDIGTAKLLQKQVMTGQIYHSMYFEDVHKLAIALQTNLTYFRFEKSWRMMQ